MTLLSVYDIFKMITTIFLLVFIFSIIFVILVVLIVLKLMRTNVDNKKTKLKENEAILESKIKDLESVVVPDSQKAKYCTYCGVSTDWKADYCENCGSALRD